MLKTAAFEIGDRSGRHAVTCTKTCSFCRSTAPNSIKPAQAETSQNASRTQKPNKTDHCAGSDNHCKKKRQQSPTHAHNCSTPPMNIRKQSCPSNKKNSANCFLAISCDAESQPKKHNGHILCNLDQQTVSVASGRMAGCCSALNRTADPV